jgi:DNA-binding response OmpR family regulator
MLHIHHSSFAPKQVLLCLANTHTVAGLNALLTQQGVAVTSAYSFSEFREAVASVDYDAVVTVTAMIKQVRDVCQIPIVNVEAFIFSALDAGDGAQATKRFDAAAFAARVASIVNHEHRRLKQPPEPIVG